MQLDGVFDQIWTQAHGSLTAKNAEGKTAEQVWNDFYQSGLEKVQAPTSSHPADIEAIMAKYGK